jgi:hypothetical protein
MLKPGSFQGLVCAVAAIAASTFLGSPSLAAAHTGEFKRFDACPSTNPEVKKCIVAEAVGGMAQIGNLRFPLVNPVTIQGGVSKVKGGVARFVGASNGLTLLTSPQPVPGGLAGILTGSQPSTTVGSAPGIGLNQLFAILELARPASEISLGTSNMLNEEGTALTLPLQIHLENPLLGPSCQIGSSASPIVLNLTAGATKPPPPNQPIHGIVGQIEFEREGEIAQLNGNLLVDNAWSAPQPEDCGIPSLGTTISRRLGLPSPAGRNTVLLQNTISIATAFSVNQH